VLRALTEAGVKIDVVAAHGAGVATALAAAIDGGSRLWDATGPWTHPRVRRAYRWRPALRVAAAGLGAAGLVLLSPLIVLVAAAAFYAASTLASLANLTAASERLVQIYGQWLAVLFSPPVLPTIVPRAMVLAVLLVFAVLAWAAFRALRGEASRRRLRGAFWWRLVGSPLTAGEPGATLVDALWHLVRGASNAPRPVPAEIGRRYVDVLADNFGQPGFREVLVAVHDLDARRDLVGGVLAPQARAAFESHHGSLGAREGEIVDFTGPQRELVVDFLLGALRLPVATAAHPMQFPAESYWRGELHHLTDRPELVARLIDEMAVVGVEQIILVSPAGAPAQPHGMRARPVDLRARIGEHVRSVETAALQDGLSSARARTDAAFVIHPAHNPIGPFDFGGVYDEASDRRRTIPELIQQGYEDAYHQFIEPIVATGDRLDEI